MKRFLCVLSALLVCAFLSGAQVTYYVTDNPLVLPFYDYYSLKQGLTGKIFFDVEFEGSHVRSVELRRQELRSASTNHEDLSGLADLIVVQVRGVIKEWRFWAAAGYKGTVEIELRIDPELAPQERRYEVAYGKQGVVEKVVIVGPSI